MLGVFDFDGVSAKRFDGVFVFDGVLDFDGISAKRFDGVLTTVLLDGVLVTEARVGLSEIPSSRSVLAFLLGVLILGLKSSSLLSLSPLRLLSGEGLAIIGCPSASDLLARGVPTGFTL